MGRGKDPQIRNQRATAEERAIDLKRSLPWELTTGCSVAIGNARIMTIGINFPSEIYTEKNTFNALKFPKVSGITVSCCYVAGSC
jgi:hypothetical protein